MVEEQIYHFLHGISEKIVVVQGLLMAIHGLPPWHPTIYLGFWFLCFGLPHHFLIQHESTMRYRFKVRSTNTLVCNKWSSSSRYDYNNWQGDMTENIDMTGLDFSWKWIVSHQRMGRLFGSANGWMSVHFRDFFHEFTIFWTIQWVWFLSKKIGAKKNMFFKIGWVKNVENLSSYHILFTKPQSQLESRVVSPR